MFLFVLLAFLDVKLRRRSSPTSEWVSHLFRTAGFEALDRAKLCGMETKSLLPVHDVYAQASMKKGSSAAKSSSGGKKKLPAAPLSNKAGKKVQKSPIFTKTPRNFRVGGNIQPRRDLSRYLSLSSYHDTVILSESP